LRSLLVTRTAEVGGVSNVSHIRLPKNLGSGGGEDGLGGGGVGGIVGLQVNTKFTCFTSTKVQILTPMRLGGGVGRLGCTASGVG
jgi:hypothetical protein